MKSFFTTILFGVVSCFVLAAQNDQLNVQNPQHNNDLDNMLHSAGVDDIEQARSWFNRLKKAILTGDRDTLMTMIAFPVRIGYDTGYTKIAIPEEFLNRYDQIITPKLIAIVDCTSFEDLWANYGGIRVGRGIIIIQSVKEYVDQEFELKIRLFHNGSLIQDDFEKCIDKTKQADNKVHPTPTGAD